LYTIMTMLGTKLWFIKQHWKLITPICHQLLFHSNNVTHFVAVNVEFMVYIYTMIC
jgi:hypothetical protein